MRLRSCQWTRRCHPGDTARTPIPRMRRMVTFGSGGEIIRLPTCQRQPFSITSIPLSSLLRPTRHRISPQTGRIAKTSYMISVWPHPAVADRCKSDSTEHLRETNSLRCSGFYVGFVRLFIIKSHRGPVVDQHYPVLKIAQRLGLSRGAGACLTLWRESTFSLTAPVRFQRVTTVWATPKWGQLPWW